LCTSAKSIADVKFLILQVNMQALVRMSLISPLAKRPSRQCHSDVVTAKAKLSRPCRAFH
jgi:hypothetical protein